jgi:hypothetical protein
MGRLRIMTRSGRCADVRRARRRRGVPHGCRLRRLVTRHLAEFMAHAALENAIEAKGPTPSGEIALACRDDAFATYCKASRPACD